jgi:hypothetical protein
MLNEKDYKIDPLSRTPRPAGEELMVESVEFRKNRVLGWPDSSGGALLSRADIRHWLQRSLTQASQDCSSPLIKLLVVENQDT